MPAGAADAEARGPAVSGEWLDRLALRVVREPQHPAARGTDDPLLGRAEFLRRGVAGALVLATGVGGLSARRAAASDSSAAAAAACNGGSLAGCYSESNKNFKATLAFCTKAFHDRFDALGCIVETVDARAAGRKQCRANCPQPKKKGSKGGKGGGGAGGGTTPPSGGGGHTPTCGQLDCATGDKCCPADAGPICCAICCNTNGNGCGSSSSDCGGG
jgi:hypothetical protein